MCNPLMCKQNSKLTEKEVKFVVTRGGWLGVMRENWKKDKFPVVSTRDVTHNTMTIVSTAV